MKLKCPNRCKVRKKAKFYRTWHVDMLADSEGYEICWDENSWSTKDVFHCTKCHAQAVEKCKK